MKKLITLILAALMMVVILIAESQAQRLEFIYAAPTATMDANFNNARAFTSVWNGVVSPAMTGYRYVRIVPGNVGTFRTVAPDLMRRTYDSINTANSALRRKLNRVMQMSDNRLTQITFFLIDDQTGLPNDRDSIFCAGSNPHNNMTIAWPCANNWRANAVTGMYEGRVMVGEQAASLDVARPGGFKRWEATLIHEVSHTQMLSDVDGINKWSNSALGVHGREISYGGDESHWFEELQADEQQPMDEGLGYFWALEHNPPMATELDQFLNDKGRRFLLGSRSFLTGIPEMWNAPHGIFCSGIPCVDAGGNTINVTLNTQITSPTGGYELRSYRWMDVPGKYVYYNEQMSEAYFYLFHQYGYNRRDTSYNKIFDAVKAMCVSANQIHRYPAHAANMLANSLEAYARTAHGRAEENNRTLVSSMFAYAIYDLLGHFGQTEAELRREFDINSATYIPATPKPIAFTRYWAHRNAIRQLACPYLGGDNCNPTGTGNIDIHRAVTEVRNYFRNPVTILR